MSDTNRDTFKEFQASQLWCDRCKMAVPVRERLLLILPNQNLYEYLCSRCGRSLGKRTTPDPGNLELRRYRY